MISSEQVETLLETAREAQRKQDKIEARIASLEERKAELVKELKDELGVEVDDLDDEIAKAETELRELAEKYGLDLDD
jgi:vacuolar-type H+-ATPase subunit I/STV1